MRLQSLLPVLPRSSHPLRYSALNDIVIHLIYAIDLLSRLLTVAVSYTHLTLPTKRIV